MKARIGYFVPEFPGQTHNFFWREINALEGMGLDIDIVSTKRPPSKIMSHTWTLEAQQRTTYLFPPGENLIATFLEILRCGPRGWFRCLWAILRARGVTLSGRLRLIALAFIGAELSHLAKKHNWNHLHVHSCADAANIAMFASMLSGLTYSLTLHGPTLLLYGPNQEQKWKYAAFALIVSERLLNVVKDSLVGFLPKQIAIAPMGVDLLEIKRTNPYIPWKADAPCKLFSCGRLNPIKGHNYLINTVELLRQQGFDVRLQIAGEDEQGGSGYRRELENIIRDKSLTQYIELLGAVSEEQIRKGLEDAHVFALASLNEGIPVAVMEAMAMETAVVVTDVGGNSELVDDGVDAILVKPEDPEEMAEAITNVLQNKELALSLSKESRKKIVAKFHHRRSAEVLMRCLKELTQELVPNP